MDLRANSVSGFFNTYLGVSMVILSGTEKIPDYGQRRKLFSSKVSTEADVSTKNQ